MTVNTYTALQRAFTQYFDQMEPILPPPRPDLYLRTDICTYVMDPQYPQRELATVYPDGQVRILKSQILRFFPEDYDFLEENFHTVPQTHDHYVCHPDISDLPEDEDFPTPTYKRHKRPPTSHTPRKGLRQTRKTPNVHITH
jgi:hypothetical protein